MTAKQEQIENILKDIDLKKIQSVMEHLEWTWKDSKTGEKRVPDVNELAAAAEHCMHMALEADDKSFNSGGFECEVINGAVELKFVIERVNPLSGIFG